VADKKQRAPADLKAKRAELVHAFFKKGAEITDELLKDNGRLRKEMARLEGENAKLRSQLAKDKAVRDLLRKIDELEHEKEELLSSVHHAEEATTRTTSRYAEIESELESFANLHVASFQLHSTLRLGAVLGHVKELLVQLVGARSLVVFIADDARKRLLPVAHEGVPAKERATIELHADAGHTATVIERVFLTGVPHVAVGAVAKAPPPVACIPLRVEETTIGTIAIHHLLEQKSAFGATDLELFKLLGAHAGTAIVAAQLFERAGAKLPSLEKLASS
jgi:hypothetical protein